jgi:two-component system NarL family sensor kinase
MVFLTSLNEGSRMRPIGVRFTDIPRDPFDVRGPARSIADRTIGYFPADTINAPFDAGDGRQEPAQGYDQPETLVNAALDALTTPMAVLDGYGRILLVNTSWRELLRLSGRTVDNDGIGAHYLDLGIPGPVAEHDALALRIGLRKVLRRAAERFQYVVRVQHDRADQWYQVRAVRVAIAGCVRVVVTHEDVTAVQTAQRAVEDLSNRLLTLQEEERHRIAAELHDSTAQQLTGAGLYLSSLRSRLPDDAETRRTVGQIGRAIHEAQKEIRTLSYLLHPPYLHRDGLRATLTRYVKGFASRTGLKATSLIPREVDAFLPEVQLALLRIVQEALSNVHRHASAARVVVRIKRTRTALLFGIFDDGRGIGAVPGKAGASRTRPMGLGVPGMHARIHQLGGVLRIRGGSRGTIVLGRIPLARCRPLGRSARFLTLEPPAPGSPAPEAVPVSEPR